MKWGGLDKETTVSGSVGSDGTFTGTVTIKLK